MPVDEGVITIRPAITGSPTLRDFVPDAHALTLIIRLANLFAVRVIGLGRHIIRKIRHADAIC